jgi:hypothetical protein
LKLEVVSINAIEVTVDCLIEISVEGDDENILVANDKDDEDEIRTSKLYEELEAKLAY